jgi:hypothetical protein
MILKIFSPKNFAKNWRFLLKLLLVFAKIVIITLVFEKNANFSAKNCQKSQKIVIITSTPYEVEKKVAKNMSCFYKCCHIFAFFATFLHYLP